ncbi:MAG: hypothetical protein KTR31_18970 [Myxococcales bacterium]|nr:hypothetical protein [Myxococcales bacterium]
MTVETMAADASPEAADRTSEGPFVGRADAVAALRASLVEGRGAWVSGRAGVGKTRLVREVLWQGDGPERFVISATCSPGDGCPLAALRRAVSVDGPPVPDLREATVVASLTQLAAGRRAVLWLDDAHWLDAASRRALPRLVHAAGVRLVLSARDLGAPQDALVRQLELRGIWLRPLEAQEAATLMGEGAESALAWIPEQERGNPFSLGLYRRTFLEHGVLVRGEGRLSVDETAGRRLELPPHADALVSVRLGAMPEEVRRLLGSIALVGRPVSVELMTYLEAPVPVGQIETSLAQAEATGWVRQTAQGEWRFTHERLREVAAATHARLAEGVHRRTAAYLDHLPTLPRHLIFERAWHHVRGWSERRVQVFRACLDAAKVGLDAGLIDAVRPLLQVAEQTGALHEVTPVERRAFHRCKDGLRSRLA